MTELKTIKDTEITQADNPMFLMGAQSQRKQDRQEAINHIKSGTMVEGAKFWAIGFFNLKEEELK